MGIIPERTQGWRPVFGEKQEKVVEKQKKKRDRKKERKKGLQGTNKKGAKGFKYVISSCWYCSFCMYCNFCMCFHFTLSRGKPWNGQGRRVCVCYAVFRDMDLNKTRHFLSHVRLLVSSYKIKQLWLDIVHVYMLNIFWPDVYTH